MTAPENLERARFEAWISAPPYERTIYRWPDYSAGHAWPGNYEDIAVQLAWEAWQEAKVAQ
jgi:hypothetical protein